MSDRSITLSAIFISLLWGLGVVLAVVDLFVDISLAALATVCVATAGVLSVRSAIRQWAKDWTTAYEVGKEAGLRRIPRPLD